MLNYSQMTTDSLIDLLFEAEDRVTLDHIREVVSRGREATPRLREIILNEDHWYEGQYGGYWIVLHAVVILSAMRDPQVLPDVLSSVMHSYFADHEWVSDKWTEILAQFGPPAIEPLKSFILEHRGAYVDNSDYSFARHHALSALTRIALDHAEVKAAVLDFISNLYSDPGEEDVDFLSFSLTRPAALDRRRGIQIAKAAYQRGVIDGDVVGDFGEFLGRLNDPLLDPFYSLKRDLFAFYDPEAITARQRRWASKEIEDIYQPMRDDLAWGGPPPFPLPIDPIYPGSELLVPEGDLEDQSGALVRAEKTGRNDPCPCGSGMKFKKCCGAD